MCLCMHSSHKCIFPQQHLVAPPQAFAFSVPSTGWLFRPPHAFLCSDVVLSQRLSLTVPYQVVSPAPLMYTLCPPLSCFVCLHDPYPPSDKLLSVFSRWNLNSKEQQKLPRGQSLGSYYFSSKCVLHE